MVARVSIAIANTGYSLMAFTYVCLSIHVHVDVVATLTICCASGPCWSNRSQFFTILNCLSMLTTPMPKSRDLTFCMPTDQMDRQPDGQTNLRGGEREEEAYKQCVGQNSNGLNLGHYYGSREGQFLHFHSVELYLRSKTRTYGAEFHCRSLSPQWNEDLQCKISLQSSTSVR